MLLEAILVGGVGEVELKRVLGMKQDEELMNSNTSKQHAEFM